MNTHSNILDHIPEGLGPFSTDETSIVATTPNRILQIALAAWRQGNLVELIEQFNNQFTFTDHAFGLEFKDKERLTEFLAKIQERFPDSVRRDNTIFSSGDRVITEWTLTATHAEPFLDGRPRKVPVSVQGISVVQTKNGKISQWSEYYDQIKSRRYSVAA
jgi:steroid delta-isomerase-like uncharacterized protein